MNLKEDVKIHNKFNIEVIDAKTGEIKQKAQAYNVILDTLYSRLLLYTEGGPYGEVMGGKYSCYTFYGSGIGTPSSSDTTLFHHEGAMENSVYEHGQDSDNHVAWVVKRAQLSEQMAVGVTLTEVGIGYGTASNNLCTHAMLKDMNGNPISILKTNTDIINIYATIYLHWSGDNYLIDTWCSTAYPLRLWLFGLQNDTGQSYIYPSSIHLYLIKEALLRNNSSYTIYTSGYIDLSKSISNDVQNKRSVWTFPRLGINEGNMKGGIGCGVISTENRNCNAFIDLPAFSGGTDITNEAVGTGDGVTTEFGFNFDFPSEVSVYKNGVKLTSGYTIKSIPAAGGNNMSGIAGCFRLLRANSTPNNHKISTSMPLVTNGASSILVLKGENILYNRAYEVGVSSITNYHCSSLQVYISDDLSVWTKIVDTTVYNYTYNLSNQEQHAKYFKIISEGQNIEGCYLNCNANNGKALVFDIAPADGDVITADYHTPYIAKDADHVLDIAFTFQFGEYTP